MGANQAARHVPAYATALMQRYAAEMEALRSHPAPAPTPTLTPTRARVRPDRPVPGWLLGTRYVHHAQPHVRV